MHRYCIIPLFLSVRSYCALTARSLRCYSSKDDMEAGVTPAMTFPLEGVRFAASEDGTFSLSRGSKTLKMQPDGSGTLRDWEMAFRKTRCEVL